MKNISVILVAMVVFLAILEANASRPTLEVRKLLDYKKTAVPSPSHDRGSGKNDIPHLDIKEATFTTDKKWSGASGMTESNGQEKDSSTDTHHYFPCAKQSQCGNEIHA
ncbi:hypothetical protein Lser_V15G27482 [Lactuca serriola]|uniref:Uncharacterized protein n=1 Tax=Lactuca sativa TaxID=4236 RepID=A0A9R1VD40_LACSA|nr:hypothetical protein LSAT_V11C600298780 [Lactuca sativa]